MPSDGVYARWLTMSDSQPYSAAVNVGRRPALYQGQAQSLVEAHLIGFKGDVYGERGRQAFVERLRPERKFDGSDKLVAQLRLDVESVGQALLR